MAFHVKHLLKEKVIRPLRLRCSLVKSKEFKDRKHSCTVEIVHYLIVEINITWKAALRGSIEIARRSVVHSGIFVETTRKLRRASKLFYAGFYVGLRSPKFDYAEKKSLRSPK